MLVFLYFVCVCVSSVLQATIRGELEVLKDWCYEGVWPPSKADSTVKLSKNNVIPVKTQILSLCLSVCLSGC